MAKVYICKEINCPYFNDSTKNSRGFSLSNYGCQFYSTAKSCHLLKGALSVQDTTLSTDYQIIANLDLDIALLRNENDAYIRKTTRYSKDCEFQELFPDMPSDTLPTRVL